MRDVERTVYIQQLSEPGPDTAAVSLPRRTNRRRVNLHTGKWTFDQAVNYFMEAGGLDREAATGEAAGAAASPTQKITYMVGKWQIMRLLGKYRDKQGANFRLGQFHDDLVKNGSLPLSLVEWILLDDRSSLDQALK